MECSASPGPYWSSYSSQVKKACIKCVCTSKYYFRTYELKVHGGTPFENGIELDASNIKCMCSVHGTIVTRFQTCILKTASGGLLPTMIRARRVPRLYVRLMTPSKSRKATLSLLPATVVTAATYVQTISCFRHSVGAACLRGRLGLPLQSEWLC